jgi:hypothetical protein
MSEELGQNMDFFSTCSIQMISVAIEPVTSTHKNSTSNV